MIALSKDVAAATACLPTAGIGASMAMGSAAVLTGEPFRTDARFVGHALEPSGKGRCERVESIRDDPRRLARTVFVRSATPARVRDLVTTPCSLERLAGSIAKPFDEPIRLAPQCVRARTDMRHAVPQPAHRSNSRDRNSFYALLSALLVRSGEAAMWFRVTSVSLVLALSVLSQSCPTVDDIHAGSGQSSPNALRCVLGDQLFFSATDGLGGQDLWTLRNGGAPRRVSPPNTTGHFPRDFVAMTGKLLFTLDASGSGRELWVTDGTAAGTAMVVDIKPGSLSSDPEGLVRLGDSIVFSADDGVHGREPWVSDGTAAGTHLLVDVRPGSTTSDPAGFVELNGRVLFAANDGSTGSELWVTDGTTAGTNELVDLMPGSLNAAPDHLTRFGDAVVFAARSPTSTGIEPFETDGSAGERT